MVLPKTVMSKVTPHLIKLNPIFMLKITLKLTHQSLLSIIIYSYIIHNSDKYRSKFKVARIETMLLFFIHQIKPFNFYLSKFKIVRIETLFMFEMYAHLLLKSNVVDSNFLNLIRLRVKKKGKKIDLYKSKIEKRIFTKNSDGQF